MQKIHRDLDCLSLNNKNEREKNMKKYMFIDAETDGLYGSFLSIAAIVCDDMGNEESVFYAEKKIRLEDIQDKWVLENVVPYLGGEIEFETEKELLAAFWEFYRSHEGCICIGDVIYPVEVKIFEKNVLENIEERKFQGPYPFLDLSSMLYAKGIDPAIERSTLIDTKEYIAHRALDDVRVTIAIWKKYIN